ncbi:Uncharacterised protein at_DN0481 [Pycnogonum litorale]
MGVTEFDVSSYGELTTDETGRLFGPLAITPVIGVGVIIILGILFVLFIAYCSGAEFLEEGPSTPLGGFFSTSLSSDAASLATVVIPVLIGGAVIVIGFVQLISSLLFGGTAVAAGGTFGSIASSSAISSSLATSVSSVGNNDEPIVKTVKGERGPPGSPGPPGPKGEPGKPHYLDGVYGHGGFLGTMTQQTGTQDDRLGYQSWGTNPYIDGEWYLADESSTLVEDSEKGSSHGDSERGNEPNDLWLSDWSDWK